MNEKNTAANRVEEPGLRITRARAKSLGTSGTLIQKPPLSKQSQALKENSKRLASDENKSSPPFPCLIKKRKTTLTDVTNVLCDKSYAHCCTGVKFQKTKPEKKGLIRKNGKVPCSVHGTIQRHRDDPKDKIAEDISKLTVAPLKIALSAKQNSTDISSVDGEYHKWTKLEDNKRVNVISSEIKERLVTEQLLHEEAKHYEIIGDLKHPIVIDIDRNQKDPLMCNLYVSDIYEYKRVIELNQRLSVDYMEIVQRDITPSMRGILIDWLVEVSEEYKLVPDTLYLTVNLIDRYLSGNFIEKQKLQLLGVACMFIASKYEEMNAPQVEDFCYITANTYARKDVLKMERKVLNFLYFQLSVPTIKTFLRRYIHVAQATYKDPLVNLEFLADYLAELTLVEYSFFRFLPSLIAASAVFLARWTLDQSDYPWNPTLEFYTSYKVADLKVTVIAMQDLQLNTINSPLNAIREKYRHDKFNCVANLSSPDPVESLF